MRWELRGAGLKWGLRSGRKGALRRGCALLSRAGDLGRALGAVDSGWRNSDGRGRNSTWWSCQALRRRTTEVSVRIGFRLDKGTMIDGLRRSQKDSGELFDMSCSCDGHTKRYTVTIIPSQFF